MDAPRGRMHAFIDHRRSINLSVDCSSRTATIFAWMAGSNQSIERIHRRGLEVPSELPPGGQAHADTIHRHLRTIEAFTI